MSKITDEDIEKLKKVFATKDDLHVMKEEIIKGVADYIQTSITNIISEHEMRLDRLEKTVGGFPPIVHS